MSVYLARKTPDSVHPPAAFVAKRLNGLAPAPIDSLVVLGRARYPEVAYDLYRSNIDAFMHATITNKTTFAQAPAFYDHMKDSLQLPITESPVAFNPAMKLSDDQAKVILSKLGMGAGMKFVGKTLEYQVQYPSRKVLANIIKIHNPSFGVGRDRLTPLGLKAFIKTLSLIEAFLSTNYYPAFSALDAEIPDIPEMDMGVSGRYISAGKRKTAFYGYVDGLKRGAEELVQNNAYKKRRAMMEEKVGEGMDVEDDSDEEEDTTHNAVFTLPNKSLAGAVTYAKPSGRPSNVNFGPPGSVPSLPGLVFPYFPGLNNPDYTTIREVCVNHFFRLFGDTFEKCKENLKEFKMGCNGLAGTKEGMMITHMYKGIELALETQTRLYLVFDPEYRGFVLLGAHFSVHDGSKWVEPVSAADIQVELAKMDTHKSAVNRIAEILSEVKLIDGAPVVVNPDDLTSSDAVAREIMARDVGTLEDTAEIDKMLKSLIWSKPYRQIGPDSFLLFLAELRNAIADPSHTIPFYIPSVRAPLDSHLFRLLATFGSEAPSLWNTRGSVISVMPEEGELKRKEGKVDPVTVPNELIILPKPVLVAYREWEQNILRNGHIAMNTKERAKDYRAHVIKDDGVRVKIWQELQEVLVVRKQRGDGEPEKKKRRGDDVPVVSAEDAIGLFAD